ncbi:MAG: rhodanese-like domain-containing protein [Sphingobacteriaceae bacterium]|nr:rhodanese-like domain-containing protein [Sphingobacteriaceae bacterium]
MKKITLILLFVVLTQGVYWAQIRNVNSEQFRTELKSNKNAVLIDLRTNDELKSKGKIKGATQIDFFEAGAEKKLLSLDKNKTYLLYCAGGGRSGDAAELMLKNGFKSLYNLENGFGEWLKKGFEVEK